MKPGVAALIDPRTTWKPCGRRLWLGTGATGLEPATSGVTGR
jgi:hypothetical protein